MSGQVFDERVQTPLPQPQGRRRVTLAEWQAEGKRRFGEKVRNWKFICPACLTVQSGQDFIDTGMEKERIGTVLGFSCIGRYRGAPAAGLSKCARNGCDWTLGGLLQIHSLEVVTESGKAVPTFEFAPEKAVAA